MILSVHAKASRLAVLGELGRYPLFISALSQCINYKLSLFNRKTPTNLISNVLTEMTEMSNMGTDCWLTRINSIEKSLKIPTNMKYSKCSGKKITSILRGKFDSFWLKKINEFKKSDTDDQNHNKLRVYKTFKSCYAAEPYLACVRNRNQRSSLTRLRISAHSLATEVLRRTRPITPYTERFCIFCQTKPTNNVAILNSTQTNTTTYMQYLDTEQGQSHQFCTMHKIRGVFWNIYNLMQKSW